MRTFFNRIFGTLHRFWYRVTGGRVGAHMGKAPVLLMTTVGRKTGKVRTWPLLYLTDGDDYIVVASNAGLDQHPAWYHNLLAQPDVEIEIGKRRETVHAEVVGRDDRAALWPRLVAIYPSYDAYTKKTTRELPVLRLHPRP